MRPDPSGPALAAVPGARLRPPGWVKDLLAAMLVLLTTFGPLIRFGEELPPIAFVVGIVPAALMLVRRRVPWVVLAACVATFIVAAFTLVLTPFSALPTGIAMFTIATRVARRTALITALCVLVAMTPAAVSQEWATLHPMTILVLLTVGFFAAAGDAFRTHRAYIAEITQRALHAEQTREAEASRRVAEDRLRIARDLHDAVAHQISVISLHAGVASRTIDNDPETARTALASVRTAARRVLGEIGNLLAALRTPGEAQPLTPTPGLGQVGALLDEFRASGLHVTERIDLGSAELPASTDLVAYRLVQEALTNAQKHGSAGRAHIWLHGDATELRLIVTNPTTTGDLEPGEPSTGHGLLGMRERVATAGGTIRSGREGTTYRLEATLPIPAASEASAR